jgi:hypothetical protein
LRRFDNDAFGTFADMDAIPKQTVHIGFGHSGCSIAARLVWPMDEAMVENLSSLANLVLTYGSTPVIAEGLDILAMTAVALILVFLAARIVRRKHGGFLQSFRAGEAVTNRYALGRLFNSPRIPALKPCPNCAAQLPLSAILCDTCDYNFLAERPGRGQKLLPSPHEVPEQKIAADAL